MSYSINIGDFVRGKRTDNVYQVVGRKRNGALEVVVLSTRTLLSVSPKKYVVYTDHVHQISEVDVAAALFTGEIRLRQ